MKKMLLAATAASLIMGSAFAQDNTPATTPAAKPTAPAADTTTTAPAAAATTPATAAAANPPGSAGSTTGGMIMGDSATVTLRYVTFSQADLTASTLDGLNVYNNQNEEVGEITDLVIKDGSTISGVVVSVGGFLGLGERYVLLDPSSVVLSNRDDTLRAYVNTSKEELTDAPEFTYDNAD